MKTAIIGLGHIGATVARNLAMGAKGVIIADRTQETAKSLAAELGNKVEVMSMDDAVSAADVLILALNYDVMKEFIMAHHSALAGKIVVDPSNPIAPDGKGGFKKTLPSKESSGQHIAALMPEGAGFVKAFGTLGAATLASSANRKPDLAALFYATDYPEAGRAIAKIITASGFAPVSAGGIDQSIRLEVGGDLHEVREKGQLVSSDQAAKLIKTKIAEPA